MLTFVQSHESPGRYLVAMPGCGFLNEGEPRQDFVHGQGPTLCISDDILEYPHPSSKEWLKIQTRYLQLCPVLLGLKNTPICQAFQGGSVLQPPLSLVVHILILMGVLYPDITP